MINIKTSKEMQKTSNDVSLKMEKFFLIWVGQFISMIGTGLSMFALGFYVYQQTNTASGYVLILICAFLPPFLLKPIGGILADRFDRRLMMVIGDLGATLGLMFIFLMMRSEKIEIWHIYLGIAMSSLFSAFQEPAYKALVTDLLPENQYAKASGLMQLASSAQYLIAPFLAAMLLGLIRIEFVFLIDISTLVIASSIVIVTRMTLVKKVDPQEKKHFFTELKDGVREFSKNRGVVRLVFTTMMILFFVGLFQALFFPMLLSQTTTQAVGISQSICASGMIVGSLVIGLFGKSRSVKMLSVSLFLAGLFLVGLGFSATIFLVTIAGFLFFATLPFINSSIEVMIRTNIDNRVQGRVWSIVSMITYLGSILAYAIAGVLADRVFNPLLNDAGLLAQSVGKMIGMGGGGKGIALMFILSGLLICVISILILKDKRIKELQR